MSLNVNSIDDLKQKIILPINHKETVDDLTEQNIDIFAEKETDFGKTNTIKMCMTLVIIYLLNLDHTELLFPSIKW